MYNNLSLSLLTPVLPAGELDTVCGLTTAERRE